MHVRFLCMFELLRKDIIYEVFHPFFKLNFDDFLLDFKFYKPCKN